MKNAFTVPLTKDNALDMFTQTAHAGAPPTPDFCGNGIVIAAGGPYVPSAYVVVRLLRELGVESQIEIWHAGQDEVPAWARSAFEPCQVTFRDAMDFCPERPIEEMRGWPIKPAAIMLCGFRNVLFIDADCFPLRNPEFLFDAPEFKEYGAVFWPDSRFHRMVPDAEIWKLTGLDYQGDTEFEAGIILLDKVSCWRELCLAEWMNAHSSFWYKYTLGDKDTYYLSWRKLGRTFFLAPPCKRHTAVVTRHYWTDGAPLADHRTGTSKYCLPSRKGPFPLHLTPYKWRPRWKNVYDELMQRFLVKGFARHVKYLAELKEIHDQTEARLCSRGQPRERKS
jgi:hypothetical protein